MLAYIGIDDTDNLNTRGTGYRARKLAEKLSENGWGEITGISRHQLFVSPEIPYTSHNSSLCIGLEACSIDITELIKFCAAFLEAESAEGSDPGLCVAEAKQATQPVEDFGLIAKSKVLELDEAQELAKAAGIHLSPHGGTGGGMIGALAGVGLRSWGQDGRFVWLKGIREVQGVLTVGEIFTRTGVQVIRTEEGEMPEPADMVDVGEWFRPVLMYRKPTLLVERVFEDEIRWRILDKEQLKARG